MPMSSGSEREAWASSHAPPGRPPPGRPPPASRLPASSHQPAAPTPQPTGPISSSSDHCAPPAITITPSTKPAHSLVLAAHPRSTSLPLHAMGQSFSKAPSAAPPAPPSSPSTAARGLNAAITSGIKLKRAFAGRRKKNNTNSNSNDDGGIGSNGGGEGRAIERAKSRDGLLLRQPARVEATPSSASSPAQVTHSASSQPEPTRPRGAKQLTQLATQVFNKRAAKTSLQQLHPGPPQHPQAQGPPPPPPPPKARVQLHPAPAPPPVFVDNRSSIIPMSPGISSAVSFMRMGEAQRDQERERERARESEKEKEREREREREREKEREQEPERESEREREKLGAMEREQEAARKQKEAEKDSKAELKDTWRKSDSTIGHHTIRPGAAAGPRPSRPVSMAESLQSNHTIVPVNKRLSALVTDVDFGMPEEELERGARDEHEHEHEHITIEDSIITTPTTAPTAQAHAPPLTPPSTSNTHKRRSMSVNITSHAPFLHAKLPPAPASASVTELKHPSHSISEGMLRPSMSPSPSTSASRETPSLSRTTANATGFIGPSSHGAQSTGSNIRGKLAALAATTSNSPAASSSGHSSHGHGTPHTHTNSPYTAFPAPRAERRLPALPPQHPQQQQQHHHQQPAPTPSFRQTAISMTNSLAPAAGLAKRAVEKMGRAWGGLSSGSSASAAASTTANTSGYSSSGSANTGTGTAPSSYSHSHDLGHELARTVSSQSSTGGHGSGGGAPHHHMERDRKGRLRRTPNAPSGSSSIASGTDVDAFGPPAGPVLGKRLRGPLRRGGGGGGVVFGRDLRTVVRETGVGVGKPKAWGGRWRNWDGDGEEEGGEEGAGEGGEEAWRARRASVRRGQLKALEERKLPALVVRCAQHLLIWGVQEEGLFRVSGRPSHVTKLRTEFDMGADFDMTECTPGDLDPHAVASVFKAYLRELPEPILTHSLLPFFEAAMNQESANNAAEPSTSAPLSPTRGPGLPSNPRNSGLPLPTMRKPPSLSTLAMPSFTGMRPPSKNLLSVFQSLIAKLPEENRDLIRTVTELIKATAKESKETKMPLSNLLLVFCPSLNMNPPLLKVLCEGEGIWEAPHVLDIKNEASPVPDVAKNAEEDAEEEEFSDARDGTEDDGERESIQSESVGRTSEDIPSSVEYHASSEDVLERVKTETRRDPVSTVYLDTDSTFADDTSSMSQPAQRSHTRNGSVTTSSLRDDGSSFTSEDQDNSARHYSDAHSHSQSPPLLTSSAESLDTPSMSSGHPSFSHLHINAVEDDIYEKKSPPPLQGTSGPMIAEPSPMGLSPTTPRRPVISNPIPITGPIHFPSSASDTTHLPASPTASEKRRSIPILSLPNFSPTKFSGTAGDGSDSPRTPDSVRAKRLKKPSLHLLFSKKSTSSLSPPPTGGRAASSPTSRPTISAPYLQSPRSASDSSISTPRSAVTAPQSSTNTLPPTLDTPIESGSLRLGLGIDIPESPPRARKISSQKSKETRRPLPVPPTQQSQFSASSASLAPGPTPIANMYNRTPTPESPFASKSTASLVSPDAQAVPAASHLRPYPTRSRALSTNSNHLGMLDDDEPSEDWTRSVLLAADVDGEWIISQSN